MSETSTRQKLPALLLGAIGVVYGDIGTSPLYALKETFAGHHPLPVTEANVLGVLSVMFWTIMLLVSVKYVIVIMRADNRGEGGSLALLSLASELTSGSARTKWIIGILGVFAAALFYGDSMITPAISVLSAVEGLNVVAPQLNPYVLPVTLAVLTALFLVQKHGTGAMGMAFGPIMTFWFATLGILGALSIAQSPHVLLALNPLYAFDFLIRDPMLSFLTLGSVVLAVTGGEALYTDMGHFGKFPIRLTWFSFVLPALVLNYFGQGALLLQDPKAIENPFYLLAPEWALIPMVLLATAATVIASQAVISGAFSVARQSVQMGLLPRMEIRQTSDKAQGQIYVPLTNWTLYLAVVYLVLTFQSSSNLAAAYGIAVTGTMTIDTILIAFVLVAWRWSPLLVIPLIGTFLAVDLGSIFLPMPSRFRRVDGSRSGSLPCPLRYSPPGGWDGNCCSTRSPACPSPSKSFWTAPTVVNSAEGTAVFLTSIGEGAPSALLHNLKHNQVLHERNILLTVIVEDKPYVTKGNRLLINDLGKGFLPAAGVLRLHGRLPTFRPPWNWAPGRGWPSTMMSTSFFISHAVIVPGTHPGMMSWRKRLFMALSRNAMNAAQFFNIPANRVIEMGTRVEI